MPSVLNCRERFHREAELVRKVAASPIGGTLTRALAVLSEAGIKHLVAGGYAVQEHGYPRATKDVDIIVPDVAEAKRILLANGFAIDRESPISVVDHNGTVVDLLPGGQSVVGGEVVDLPEPTNVSFSPNIVPLDELIRIKLSASRAKDFADVVELIKANHLPEDFVAGAPVADDYLEAWHVAKAEEAVSSGFRTGA